MGTYDGPRVIEDLEGCSWSKCFYQMVGTFVIFAVVQVGEILYASIVELSNQRSQRLLQPTLTRRGCPY